MLKAILKVFISCVALVLLVGVAAYFSTSIQRFMALRILRCIDAESELRSIKIRWNTIELQGLKLTQESMRLHLDRLELQARFLSFIKGPCIEVDNCDVSGLRAHIASVSKSTPMAAAETLANATCRISSDAKDFEGPCSDKENPTEKDQEPIDLLPRNIILKSLKISGDIYLPLQRHVKVNVKACNIAPGAQGNLQCIVSSTVKELSEGYLNANFDVLQSELAQPKQLSLAGAIDASFEPHIPSLGSRFENLGLHAKVDFEVQSSKLTLKTLDANLTDATKLALLSCKLLQRMDVPLAGINDHATTLNGDLLELKAEPMPLELLKPFIGEQIVIGQFGGGAMRVAASEGNFFLNVTEPITFTEVGWGPQGTVAIQGLGARLDFGLNYTPAFSEDAPFDGNKGLGKLVLQSLHLALTHTHGLDWVQLGFARPINIPLDGDWDSMLENGGDLVSIGIKPFDFNLFAGVLPKNVALNAKMQPATVFVRAQKGAAVVTASPNLSLQGLTYTQNETVFVHNLNLAFAPTVSIQPGKILDVSIASIALGTAGVQPSWATSTLKAQGDLCEKPRTLRAQLLLSADLAQALTQPVLNAYNHLQSGHIDLDAQGSFSQCKGEGDFKFTLKGSNIQAQGNDLGPAGFNFEGEGEWSQQDGLSVDIPIQVQASKGTSDLHAKVQQNKDGGWVAAIDSKMIYVEDVLAVANAFQAPEERAKIASQPAADTAAPIDGAAPIASNGVAAPVEKLAGPLWGQTCAEVTLKIDTVVQNNYAVLENCQGHFFMNPAQMNLDKLQGIFSGAALQAQGVLNYNGTTPANAYSLNSQLAMTGFDVARFLQSTGLSSQPPVVGLFDFTGKLSGHGLDMISLMEQAQGNMSVTSDRGTFYVLAAGGKTARAGAAVVGIAGIVNALAGSNIGQIDTLNRVTQLLQKIDYTQLRIEATRGPDLNIVLNPFLVQGEELRLFGTGSVAYKENVAIVDQPLLVTACIDAKGSAAETFRDINLLSNEVDSAGYYKGPKFSVTGTVTRPNFSELNSILEKAVIGVAISGSSSKSGGSPGSATDAAQNALKGIKGLLGL